MKIEELCTDYGLSCNEVEFYIQNGVFSACCGGADEEQIERLCTVLLLREAGMEKEKIVKCVPCCCGQDTGEKVRLLRELREKLLCGVHARQKLIDKIDYLLYKIAQKGEGQGQ